jgi:hypothetical protein
VCKAQFLNADQMHVLVENANIVLNKKGLKQLKAMDTYEEVIEARKEVT